MSRDFRFQASASMLALLGLCMVKPAHAQTQPTEFTWYGRIDLALERNNNGVTQRVAVQNFASRLGIRGEHALGNGLAGIFQVETGVAPDDSSQSKAFANRNSFIGLKSGDFGTLLVGTHDMPLKSMEGTAYGLWGEGDLQELIIHGKGSRVAIGNANFDNVHTRKTNVLLYTSPKVANITLKLAYSPDEAKKAAAAGVPEYSQPMYGASVYYDDGLFNAGIATQGQSNYIAPTYTAATATAAAVSTDGSTMKANKLTIGVKMDGLTAGLATSKLDNSRGRKTTNLLFTGTYALGATTLKASYGRSGESADNAEDGVKAMALEVDQALDKSFTVYGYYARIYNAKNAKATFTAADNFPAVSGAGQDPRAVGVGIRYNF